MAVLTTVGRKSGAPRRHCVRAIRKGTRVYLVSIPGKHAAWLTNLRANPHVSLQVRGMTLVGMAHEARDDSERDEAKAVYVGTINAADYIECFLHWQGRPTRWKIQQLHEMWFDGGIPVVIVLDGPDAPTT